jgi:hypothetical protein
VKETLNSTVWNAAHIQTVSADMSDVILLDNQSSMGIFCNPKLVENIRKSDKLLELTTNTEIL